MRRSTQFNCRHYARLCRRKNRPSPGGSSHDFRFSVAPCINSRVLACFSQFGDDFDSHCAEVSSSRDSSRLVFVDCNDIIYRLHPNVVCRGDGGIPRAHIPQDKSQATIRRCPPHMDPHAYVVGSYSAATLGKWRSSYSVIALVTADHSLLRAGNSRVRAE